MPRPTTEIAVLALRPEANLADPNSEGSRIWRDCLKTASTYKGFQKCLYNVDKYNKNILVQLLDWESMEAHQAMIDSPGYAAFLDHVGTIMEGAPNLKHTRFTIYDAEGEVDVPPSTAFKGMATTINKFYLPSSVDVATVNAEALSLLRSLARRHRPKAMAKGWLLEQVEHEAVGGIAKVLVLVIGWDDPDKAMTFSASMEYKDKMNAIGAKASDSFVASF
ncbi:hypothetical protein Forpe1208_v016767 [Fusarium oxysporum f. sp. rapae]|uniref:ABM domain-containing protein n=1 Tax=Fusarium oxysporum f. sp. rapae TaxID=485398 RepID=A0A8J5TWR0_FUSOX|nr:hypothetical protein Forpe1208_v016767 [Fusarium oxysporum f. sp. rapae]